MIGTVTLKPGRLGQQRLTRPERRLWEAYPTGAEIDLGPGEPAADVGWGPRRTIRAEVISALLLGARDSIPGMVPAVRLHGARITGRLDVSGGEVGCELWLQRCVLEESPDFSNANARQIRVTHCWVPGFDGGGLRTDGYLSLSDSMITGEVRLTRARLSGGFRMNDTTITNPGGYTLFAGGLTVEGGTFFRNATLIGITRITGAQLGGGFFLEDATLRDPGGISLPTRTRLDPLHVGALVADNITVEDQMECGHGFTADGLVRLRGARINGTLSFDEGCLRNPQGRALHLGYSRINELILTPREPIQGQVQLGYSRIDVILDSPSVWPEDLRLNGLVYETLRGAPEGSRLDWISRDTGGFRPQPYEQLASYLRRIGRDDLARRTQVAKQRARRPRLNPFSRFWSRLLDWTVGYGYRPWIAVVWLVALLTLGTLVFGHIHPHSIKQPDERPRFHSFIYTLDLMLPIETFGQRSAWDPVGWTYWLADVLTAAGWVLATALIAGATRVLRPG